MRGKRAPKREVDPDPKYNSKTVSKLINYVMQDGKKITAVNIVYDVLESLGKKNLKAPDFIVARLESRQAKQEEASKEADESKKLSKNSDKKKVKADQKDSEEQEDKKLSANEVFEIALSNVMPNVEIRSRRIGGANYQVPVPVSPQRKLSLGLRWIVEAARASRKTTDFATALERAIETAFKNEGPAVKKKEDVEKMAEANKAFSQFA
jgi:small subunit ribosomal protein S7